LDPFPETADMTPKSGLRKGVDFNTCKQLTVHVIPCGR